MSSQIQVKMVQVEQIGLNMYSAEGSDIGILEGAELPDEIRFDEFTMSKVAGAGNVYAVYTAPMDEYRKIVLHIFA